MFDFLCFFASSLFELRIFLKLIVTLLSYEDVALYILFIFRKRCEGFVIDRGGDNTDFCISGPTKKVDKASVHLSRYVKQTLKGATKKAFDASQEKSKHDYVYRKAVRAGHLRKLALEEVEIALKSKARTTAFSFGLASPDVDLELFGLDFIGKKRKTFSLRDKT